MAAMSLCGFSRDVRTSVQGQQTAHFSRSWLAMLRTLRFTSLDKRPVCWPCDDGRRAGSVGSFFPEIKRSEASHSGKK
jgi:hypothetical protein